MTGTNAKSNGRRHGRLHPLAIRIMHWINAVAMIVMIMSGWAIYNDEVIFGWLHFPGWMTHRRRARRARCSGISSRCGSWSRNGIAYLAYGLSTGRFRRMLLPIRIAEIIAEIRAVLALKLAHDDLTHYNAVQRVLYIGVIVVIILQVLSGLVVWKPVQFSELALLFYDFQGARLVHFLGMAAIVGFLARARGLGADRAQDAGRHADRRAATCQAERADDTRSRNAHRRRKLAILRRHRRHVTAPTFAIALQARARHRPERARGEPRAAPASSIGARSCAAASASARSPCSRAAT